MEKEEYPVYPERKFIEDSDNDIIKMENEVDKKMEKIEEAVKDKFEEFDKDVSSVMGEVPNENKIDNVIDTLKSQQQKGDVDLSVLKGDKRLEGESFEEYKARLKIEKKIRKRYEKGRVAWKSIFDGPKRGHFKEDKD